MRPSRILLCQSIGFVAIIALSWVDELLGLRSLILGNHPYISDFRESTFEMLVVLAVWLLVCRSTGRVLSRLDHLEKFTKVCSWCRRVGVGTKWMPLEEFLKTSFDARTTHGICDECSAKQETAIKAAQQQHASRTQNPNPVPRTTSGNA